MIGRSLKEMKKSCRSRLQGGIAPYSTARRTDLKRLLPDTVSRAPENRKDLEAVRWRSPDRRAKQEPAKAASSVDIMIRSNLCFFAVSAITSAASPLRST